MYFYFLRCLKNYQKSKDVFDYVIALNVIGALIAAYNYYLQVYEVTGKCGVGGIDCSKIYFIEFGYITIPLMALTAFVWVGILTWVWKKYSTAKKEMRVEED